MSRPRVFLDVSIAGHETGRLVFELFSDKAPRTCENFRALCTGAVNGMTYKLSPFHRIIDEFMVQGGDITNGDGTGGESIYGGEFEDENLDWREIDREGLLCMANRGKDTNSSQFFITLAPTEHLNGKHTVFGQLISGQDTLESMAEVAVDKNDKPKTSVLVAHCGELEKRKKAPNPDRPELKSRATMESDISRGRPKRRRPSDMSITSDRSRSRSRDDTQKKERNGDRRHRSGSRSISPVPIKKRVRRRSDLSVDENIRGRTRRRSTTISPIDESPERKGRRRSSSPSRGPRQHAASRGYRRRRSLPNHYQRYYGEEGRLREAEMEREGGDARYEDAMMDDVPRGGMDRRDDGRLGGGDYGAAESGGGIKFKGRGAMKYREKMRY